MKLQTIIVSDLLKNEKIRQLLPYKTPDQLMAILGSSTFVKCKDMLENHLKIKEKIIWLGVTESQFDEAMKEVDEPDFFGLSKVLKKGNYD